MMINSNYPKPRTGSECEKEDLEEYRYHSIHCTGRIRMNKREFMTQYILNRALGNSGGLEAKEALKEAEYAWSVIDALPPVYSATYTDDDTRES